MKRILHFLLLLLGMAGANAANLIDVYQSAEKNDPIFQQAIADRCATKEGVPISVASLLPNLSFSANPSVSRYSASGAGQANNSTLAYTQRAYSLNLSLTQTVFNFAQIAAVRGQLALSKGADAALNTAWQDLMTRTADAYFTVLKDQDTLAYSEANKRAFTEQLDQNNQQFKVGLKTITDVDTAQASNASAIAEVIAAKTTLENDKENLRVITGVYYDHLDPLSDRFPLITPKPANIDEWVTTAQKQNWSIKATRYNTSSAKQNIAQQASGHLPTVSVQGNLSKIYSDRLTANAMTPGLANPNTATDNNIVLNVNFPIFSGGSVIAQTNQASYQYESAQQQLEQAIRNTINVTRQSYNQVVAGISQIAADKLAIKSNKSSLRGLNASYQVGTATLVDVLNQQQKLYSAQTQYATDRYAYISNLLALKKAAGTLSFEDIKAINTWLIEKKEKQVA